jgi:hypothetical protein
MLTLSGQNGMEAETGIAMAKGLGSSICLGTGAIYANPSKIQQCKARSMSGSATGWMS